MLRLESCVRPAGESPVRVGAGAPLRGRAGQDIREVIADLNPILRGWGNYFRTGNAAKKFNQIDRYVEHRLWRLMRKRYGRNLHPGQWKTWTREWFEAHGLYRLRGTIRYPGLAS